MSRLAVGVGMRNLRNSDKDNERAAKQAERHPQLVTYFRM